MYILIGLCSLLMSCHILHAEEIRKLSVSGSATVHKSADILTLILAVETYDQDVRRGTQHNGEKMQAVISGLVKAGLSKKEIETKNFTVTPQLTPPPKNPPEDWQPSIAGYRIRNTLEIRSGQLELAGQIIDAAAKLGVNAIDSISYALQDEEQAKSEAIAKAYIQAKKYAQAVAEEAKIKLEKIMEISINQPYASPVVFKASRMTQEASTPISAREVEISASVSVVYSLLNP